MKIVYLLGDENISSDNGVVKKVGAQTAIWKQLGHEVRIISLRSKSFESVLEDATIISHRENSNSPLQNLRQQTQNYKTLQGHLEDIKPDIIYMRYLKYYPGMITVLKNNAPYIIEINSDEYAESQHGKYNRYIFNALTRNFLLGNAKGFVYVSKELSNNKNYTKFHKLSVVIGNGYDFSSKFPVKKEFNTQIQLVFIGSPGQRWHGLDKIVYLAQKLPEYIFHIIGPSIEEMEKIQTNLSSNLVVHGYLDQHASSNIIAQCDVGISTLALHRNRMKEASPLKSRQYLAQGLPIIIGYEDTDLSKDHPFVLNIGNDEDNVRNNIETIRTFIENITQNDPEIIRKEARKILDYTSKEKKRLFFFQSLMQESDNEQ